MSNMFKIVAGWKAVNDLVASGKIATAADPEAMRSKIEALRTQFKEQAVQVEHESKQKLAGLLREVSHVLTDLIHSMNICGKDANAMTKLQQQVGKVTQSLSFVGEEDANGDGIKDGATTDLGLNLGNNKTTNDSHEAFKSAVKSIKKVDDSTDKKEEKKEPVVEESKKTGEKEDSEGDEKADKPKKKIALKTKKSVKEKESDDSEDSEDGGLVKSLLAEGSYQALAGLRFAYLGIKTVTKSGEKFKVIRAGFGDHSKNTMKVYYYRPTKQFFGGDCDKADKAFRKILDSVGGYAMLSTEINAKERKGYLKIVSSKEVDAAQVMHEAESSWSYRGIDMHPMNDEQQALCFEIGAVEFYAVPTKKFENADINEADAYIRANIVGSKKHGTAGVSYLDGLKKLEQLVDAGKLKVVYHGAV